MIKKKYLLLFLCLIMFVTDVSRVRALEWGFSGDTSSVDSDNGGSTGGNGSGGKDKGFSKWIEFQYGDRKLKYRYRSSIYTTLNYKIRATSPDGDIIKSGTWMGINIDEEQTANWSVSKIEYQEVWKVFTCTKEIPASSYCGCYLSCSGRNNMTTIDGAIGGPSCRSICPGDANYNTSYCTYYPATTETVISGLKKPFYSSYTCPPGTKQTVTTEEKDISPSRAYDKSQEAYNAVHNAALGRVGPALSKVQITTEDLDANNNYKTITIDGVEAEFKDEVYGDHGKVTKTYRYKPDSICIDLKTGKVSYNKTCQTETEAQVLPYYSGGVEYWQYFSPLNMKSGSSFGLVIQQGRELNEKECKSIRNIVGNSCKLNKSINFSVVQKYYYEETKNNKLVFNGYNLYYRPININNPFPTIPTENSLWYKWYNSKDKSPNLKDSFNEVTYSVDVPNKLADTIRAYNVNNPYPSFDILSLSGTSDFLRSIGVEALTKDKKYGLGGGTRTCVKNGTVSIGSDCS